MADLGLFTTDASLTTVGQITGGVFATSALAGILGLFQSLSVQTADNRLVISGYRRVELVAARFATVITTALLVAVVTTISLEWLVSGGLKSVTGVLIGLFVAGVLSGLVGVLVGSVLPRKLEGSLVLVAIADVSAIVASGLFGVSDDIADLFPLSNPYEVVLQGVVDGTVATAHVLPALGYSLIVVLLSGTAYIWVLPAGGDAE